MSLEIGQKNPASGEGCLAIMKIYGEQYLEAHNGNMERNIKDWLNENYQRFRISAQKSGENVSRYPENLEELIQ
jgi:hypothetical protein